MSLVQDLRFAVRLLLKRPGLTAVIVGLLAVGIGINSTVFTLVNAVLLRGLPFEEGERIVFLESMHTSKGDDMRVSYPDFDDWRGQSKTFRRLAAFSNLNVNLSDDESVPSRYEGVRITADALRLLRVSPALGRDFLDGEDRPGAEKVVLIGWSVWRNRYGGDDSVLGRTVRLNEVEHTVIGVMPEGFRFPSDADIWTPLIREGELAGRGARRLGVFGRLADDVAIADASAEMNVIADRLARQYPDTNEDVGAAVLTFNEQFNGGEIRAMFLAMSAAVGFVLLIACANVANIQLARSIDRAKEISLRAALGAGRLRIVRQLLAESVLLAAMGGALGLGLAWFGIRGFDEATRVVRPYWIEFYFDARVFGYLVAICLATGILFGLAPTLHAVRRDVNTVLKEGRGQTSGRRTRFFASSMVVGQIVLAMVLLVGSGLMIRSFQHLTQLDLGVRTEGVLGAAIDLPEGAYSTPAERVDFYRQVLEKSRALPGVRAATAASNLPAMGFRRLSVELAENPQSDPDQRPRAWAVVADAGYFDALGAPLLAGREFDETDTLESAPVAIVNRLFAERHWPGESPIGRQVRTGYETSGPWMTVVGVAPNIIQLMNEDPDDQALLYLPYRQEGGSYQSLILIADGDPNALAEPLREAVASLDSNLPVFRVSTLDDVIEQRNWAPRLFGAIFAIFALFALVMSAVGIYALTSDSVGRRTSEFGVRMALGADSPRILRLVLSQGMRRALIGVGLGLPAAFGAAHALQFMLVGVGPSDPVTLAGISAILLGVALLACWLPARRAVRVSPSAALRCD